MSRWLPNRLTIFIGRDQHIADMKRRSLGRRSEESSLHAYAVEEQMSSFGSHGATLNKVLSSHGKRRIDASIVISNYFARYLLLPYSEALRSKDDWLQFASNQFTRIYGEPINDWSLQLDEAWEKGNRLVSAIPAALLNAIRLECSIPNVHLRSVVPQLMLNLNRAQKVIDHQLTWLLSEDTNRLTIACFVDGVCSGIRQRNVSAAWHETIEEFLDRESLLFIGAKKEARVLFDAPGLQLASNRRGNYRLEVMPGV